MGGEHRGNLLEEQDSWFSGPTHNASRHELYDTIEDGDGGGGDSLPNTAADGLVVNDILKKYGATDEPTSPYQGSNHKAVNDGTNEELGNSSSDDERTVIKSKKTAEGVNKHSHTTTAEASSRNSHEPVESVNGQSHVTAEGGNQHGQVTGQGGSENSPPFQYYNQQGSDKEEVDLNALLKLNQRYVFDDVEDVGLLENENPSQFKRVSRTSHSGGSSRPVSHKKSTRKAAEFRHNYFHHRKQLG